jgi:hypothetical protein
VAEVLHTKLVDLIKQTMKGVRNVEDELENVSKHLQVVAGELLE